MKHIKRWASLLAVILVLAMSFGLVSAQAPEPKIPNPTSEFYSNDFADILNYETEQALVSLGESFYKTTGGGQVVFVSIDTLDGYTIEEYANALYNKWKIGTKDKGVLFLLSMQERESRIEVGYGYEGVLTDIQSYRLLEKFAAVNQESGIDEAVKTIYQDIWTIVSGEGDTVQYPEIREDNSSGTNNGYNFFEENPILTIIIAIIVIILIILDFALTGGQITFFILRIMAASARRGGGGGRGGGGNFGGGGRSGGGGASGRF